MTLSVLCLIALLLGGCQGKYKTKEELLTEGMKLLASGNTGGAIVLLKNALDKDQKYFEARLQLARAYTGAGKFESAEKELQKLVRQRPDSRDVHVEMARMHLRKSRPDDALRELASAGKGPGAGGDEAELTAWAYALKGRYEDAVNHLDRAIAADPARVQSKMILARIHARKGAWKEATAGVADILKTEPANREALYLLAAVRTEQRDFPGALEAYDRILKQKPDDQDVLYRKGILFSEKGDHDASLAAGDMLVERSPNSASGHLMRGIALYNKKHLKDAAVSLQKAVTLQPGLAAYYYLSVTLYGLREFEQAAGQIQKALDQNPAFGQGRVLLAMILLGKRRIDDAVREAKKATDLDEDNAAAHNVLGTAYLEKGMFNEGIAELNRALDLNPRLVDAHIKKGLFHLSRGRSGEGELELISAVRISPEVLNTRMVLASYYQKNGEYDKVRRLLQEGLTGGLSDAVLYNMMAESCLNQNNLDEAAVYYRKAREANAEDTHAPFRLASVYIARGERDKAIGELGALVARIPNHTRVLATIAILQETAGNEAEARRYFKQARETGSPDGYLEEARYYLRKKDPGEAIDLLNEAIKKYPSNESLHEFKGKVQMAAKDYRSAIRTFDELEKLNSRAGLPSLLNAYLAAGEHSKALEKIEKELRRDPRRLDLKARRSGIFLMLGKKREAADNAREVISADPRDAAGYIALAMVYRNEGNLEKAVETLTRYPARDPDLALMLAGLLVQKKDAAAALVQCGKAEELRKDNLPAIVQKGMILQSMGRKKEAIDQYRRALRLDPNYAPALNNMACLYAEDGQDAKLALQYAVRAYMLMPGDGAVNDTLGYILIKKGRTEEGLKALKNAVALLPDNASVYYHLGLAYHSNGNTALAIESLSKAIALGGFSDQGEALRLLNKLEKEKRS